MTKRTSDESPESKAALGDRLVYQPELRSARAGASGIGTKLTSIALLVGAALFAWGYFQSGDSSDGPPQSAEKQLPKAQTDGAPLVGIPQPSSPTMPQGGPTSLRPEPVPTPPFRLPVQAVRAAAQNAGVSPAVLYAVVEFHHRYAGHDVEMSEETEGIEGVTTDLEKYARGIKERIQQERDGELYVKWLAAPQDDEQAQAVLTSAIASIPLERSTTGEHTLFDRHGGEGWRAFTWPALARFQQLRDQMRWR